MAGELDTAADRIGRRGERAAPQPVAHDGDGRAMRRIVFVVAEPAALLERDAEESKEVAGDQLDFDARRVGAVAQRHCVRVPEGSYAAEAGDAPQRGDRAVRRD